MTSHWERLAKERTSRRRLLQSGGALSLGAAALTLLGCGSSGSSKQKASGGATAGSAVPPGTYIDDLKPLTTVKGDGKSGGTLKVHFSAVDPPELDPFTTTNVQNGWLAGFTNNGLVKWREGEQYGDLKIVNDLAVSYEQADPSMLIFKLRPGVRWHDVDPLKGRPLTAGDFKFTIDRALERSPAGKPLPDRGLSETYGAIQSVDAPDDLTLRIKMTPDGAMLNKLAHPQAVPTAPEIVAKWDRHPPTLPGVGPFVMTEYRPGERFSWKRNPNYWKGKPYLDGVEAYIQTDRGARLANLRAGQVNLDEIVWSAFKPFQTSNPQHYIVKSAGNVQSGLGINHAHITDKRVRQALSRATDIKGFIDIVWDGQARRNGGAWWWQAPYALSEDEIQKLAPYDPQAAKQLLSAAGVPNFKFASVATSGGGTGAGSTTQHLEIWRDQLRKVGIDMSITTFDQAQYLERVYVGREHDVYCYAGAATHEDPDRFWFIFMYTKAGRQAANYSDPRLDEYLLAAQKAPTLEVRVENYKKAQRLNLEDPGYIFFMTPYNFTAIDPKVRNWLPTASYGSVTRNSDEMWIDA